MLTGVRAVAAYLVFLHHFNPFPTTPSWQTARAWAAELHVGVPIFFVLSGFLITLRYADADFSQPGQWRRYFGARFARIYPLYLLVVLATYLAFWRAGRFSVSEFLVSLSLTQGFFTDYKYLGLSQAWSLTTEECFYLTAPLMFAAIRRRVPMWAVLCGLLAVGSLLVAVGSPLRAHTGGFFGSWKFMLLFTFFGSGFTFCTGIQLARWYQQNRLPTSRGRRWLTTAGILFFLLVLAGLVAAKGGRSHGFESGLGILLYNMALPLAVAVFFAGLLTEKETWVHQVLASRWLGVLGKSSYAFYLIHFGVIQNWLALHLTSHSGVLFVVLNVLAMGLHYLLEEPISRWLRPASLGPATAQTPGITLP